MANENKKVLLSLRNVSVQFNVRGRILTAIRNVSLDIFENESLAIVGESGSGKSVLTKTFAGMLDSNGFIPEGSIIFSDDELSQTTVKLTPTNKRLMDYVVKRLNQHSTLERGAAEYRRILEKEAEIKHAKGMSIEEDEKYAADLKAVRDSIVDTNNFVQTLDKRSKTDQEEIRKCEQKLAALTQQEKDLVSRREETLKQRAAAYEADTARKSRDEAELGALKAERERKIAAAENSANPNGLSDAVIERNRVLGYEVLLSIGRYPLVSASASCARWTRRSTTR